ncbi:MAG: SGNH/GDSL hydrolase family protein [Actinomycetes bacterium]|uniref:SGNH/GDSL hydrolase family protein n=1 Tax=Agrococcus sp. BE272 TaxID=2817727 RepID=UPI0028666E34|nr:SGNH/GDSL hydrolase family protein [Agrococcus sp. BE272]MDR7234426.1 lysophospholipase L1-like esterase [Agrococcus sp. BE272]
MQRIGSFVAIGDSFTEGVGDELPDGSVRGWADFVAAGLASAQGAPVRYANLAIRGRKLGPILHEQLDAAIALGPDAISINGGGNDILRPKVSIEHVGERLADAAHRIAAAGIRPILLSGGNPSGVMPIGAVMQRRGDALARAVESRIGDLDAPYVDNWSDPELAAPRFWSRDRLHLNAAGHAHVARNVLRALGMPAPEAWRDLAGASTAEGRRDLMYYREYVLPWLGRRFTGRSSGDGRDPKLPAFVEVPPIV